MWPSWPAWLCLLLVVAVGLPVAAAAQQPPNILVLAPRPVIEVHDLEADPHELVNLAGRPEAARIARELSRVLDAWIDRTEDFPPSRRRRADNTDRVSGVKFSQKVPRLEP